MWKQPGNSLEHFGHKSPKTSILPPATSHPITFCDAFLSTSTSNIMNTSHRPLFLFCLPAVTFALVSHPQSALLSQCGFLQTTDLLLKSRLSCRWPFPSSEYYVVNFERFHTVNTCYILHFLNKGKKGALFSVHTTCLIMGLQYHTPLIKMACKHFMSFIKFGIDPIITSINNITDGNSVIKNIS